MPTNLVFFFLKRIKNILFFVCIVVIYKVILLLKYVCACGFCTFWKTFYNYYTWVSAYVYTYKEFDYFLWAIYS